MDEKQPVTVEFLDSQVRALAELRGAADAKQALLTEVNKQITALEQQIAVTLKELGRTNFQAPVGTVGITRKWRVGLPQSKEDWDALVGWMEARGISDEYLTVNSISLNSLYTKEWEAAKKRGEGMEFTIPGIAEPKLFETITFRKKGN
jgi:hypothetical protein